MTASPSPAAPRFSTTREPSTSTVPAPIEASRLTVRYGRSVALDDVTFRVEPGAVHALLGRNGAGKSSAVRCLLGLRPPSDGEARLLGSSSWRHRTALMERVGVVAERPDLPPWATARAIARFVADLRPRFDGADFEDRLQRLGVPADRRFDRLSRGQQTLVQLSLALSSLPEVLVLDDPTLGLDVVARAALYDELVDTLANREVTVLLTTHDLDGVERFATHVGILAAGRMAAAGPLEELKRGWTRWSVPGGVEPAAVGLAATLVARRTEPWGGERWVTRGPLEPGTRERALGRGLRAEPMTLEEIFVHVTDPTRPEPGRPSPPGSAS